MLALGFHALQGHHHLQRLVAVVGHFKHGLHGAQHAFHHRRHQMSVVGHDHLDGHAVAIEADESGQVAVQERKGVVDGFISHPGIL